MRIILAPNEINEAINNVIGRHIQLKDDQTLAIKVKPVKGVGLIAEVDVRETPRKVKSGLPNLFPNLIN